MGNPYKLPPCLIISCVSFSADAIDLIRRLMTVRASDRLTAEAALHHSWLDDPEVVSEARILMESERRKTSDGTRLRQTASPMQNGGRFSFRIVTIGQQQQHRTSTTTT